MTCFPGVVRTGMSEEAYIRQMHGVGPTYKERQRERVPCGEPGCNVELNRGSRIHHWRRKHGKEDISWADAEVEMAEEGGQTWEVEYAPGTRRFLCPVDHCVVEAVGYPALRNLSLIHI